MSPIYVYDRLDEPTVGMLEDFVKELEGGETACAFACGMAAISATLVICSKPPSEIIAHRTLYGCTFSLMTNWLPKFGITTKFVDLTQPSLLEDVITDSTKIVYFESPSNPTLELVDIAAVKKILDGYNEKRSAKDKILIVMDNTFATPYTQRPLSLGADIVVMSLTKNMCGFGVDMGGMATGPLRLLKAWKGYRKDFGGVLSPSSAWSIMVYGISTLGLRIRKQQESAMQIAGFLNSHPKISKVLYPGLKNFPQAEIARRQMVNFNGEFSPGNMIYFELKGDIEKARSDCKRLMDYIAEHSYSITMAVSLGMTKSLIEAPGLMTHSAYSAEEQSKAGIFPGGIRFSVGLENVNDIMKDLQEALDHL
jgi:cystathionine beta-lyase/cystathionine gamma-synthase